MRQTLVTRPSSAPGTISWRGVTVTMFHRVIAKPLAEQGVSASAVSQHLAVLRATGLVTGDRVGRQVYYSLTCTGGALLGSPSGP